MSSKWSEIWQQRILAEKQSDINLIDLLRLNGWDSGAGYLNSNDWIQFTKSIAQQIGLQDGMSIFEVGCGGGAFLYPLANSFDIEIGGLDYAPNLVATAKLALPKGQFSTGDACSLDAAPQYDFVLAHSLFQYLDPDAARRVLRSMLSKARSAIIVLDVPNLKTRDEAEAVRRGVLGEDEYNLKYTGLEHTYYEREWIEEQCKSSCTIEPLDAVVANYAQSKFRFGMIGWLK